MSYFGTIPSGILRNKSISSDAKVLYCFLTLYSEGNGDVSLNYFSLKNLTGFEPSNIKYYLTELLTIKAIAQLTKTKISLNPFKKTTDQIAIDYNFVDVFIDKWNLVFRRDVPDGIYRTDELVAAITAREKVFGKDKLLEAIEKQWIYVHEDEWFAKSENRIHRGKPLILLKEDKRVENALRFVGKVVASSKESPTDESMLD